MDAQLSDDDMSAKFARMRLLAEEAEAEVISEEGTVRVVAGPSGQIKEIEVRLHALELSGAELGDVITETLKSAGRAADRTLAEEIGRLLGREVPPNPFNGGTEERG
ncbi:YbaB/EbfC family nucleoid-associated protein [Glycomyces paridis]|uniref:YbaB/EbfC family nucleoid-associated protein n=1 Tax=Glycomyces paridis TaxID=2126555 RepID=A0A4S8PKK5_9ACTN|nr:YbaB/EbfC family nucleoid-associated protein [Glycomyces paridis]THV30102.1 YbaB/EbfC family nucleoid-associated protein [Glycomyces paridis]